MKTETYHIQTCMGEITSFRDQLDFLSEAELKEFNLIGYSGGIATGESISQVEYLNTLNKGHFARRQTKFDDGTFVEEFVIFRVI